MIDEELYKELQVTYYDLQSYLLNKYGPVKYDYFANAECRSRSKKISRTNEGLYCHHMDEDKGANLSDPISAQRQPYEWQKKDRLVYCNVLEHLILHIKIAVLRQKKMLSDTKAIDDFFTTGGIFELCLAINELFEKGESNSGWRKACYEKIKKNYEDYILLLQTVIMYIDKCYLNEKRSRCLKVGACVSISNENYEIVGITKKRDKVLLKHQLGGEKVYPVYLLESQLEYTDHIDMVISKMASMYEGFCDNVYFDIQKYQGKETAAEFAKILDVDFAGFGFARFINFKLAEYYGAENADEYIANAFPTYCSETDDLNNKHPRFWRGANIPIQAKDSFYIVRIETMFSVKKKRLND